MCAISVACETTNNSNNTSNLGTYKYTTASLEGEEAKKKDIDFECMSNGKKIRGSIRLPENYNSSNNKRYPVAILSHGILTNRNQGILFIKLVDKLETEGIISIRFDFDGCGESEGNLADNSIKTECEDLKSVIKYVNTLNYVDTNNVNLIGYSMGGAVTSIVAGEMPTSIKSTVLWSPAANMIDACEEGKLILDNFMDIDDLSTGNNDIGEEYTFGKVFIEDAIGIDIYGEAKKYTGPVLILQGDKDRVVPKNYSEKYNEVYDNSNLKIIKNGEHIFSGEQLEEVISLTSEFLVKEN